MASETIQILRAGLAEWSIALSDQQAAQFQTYADMLVDWNAHRMNLTRLVLPREIAVLHFLDSLAVFKVAEIPASARVLDIGAGAGFPGLPMKILRPDLHVTLLEATAKKLVFCRAVVDSLELREVETIHGRAEEIAGRPGRSGYDVVTARGVAPLATLLGWSMPFVRVGGLFVAWKGARAEQEMAEAGAAARAFGAALSRAELALPESGDPPVALSYVLCRRGAVAGRQRRAR